MAQTNAAPKPVAAAGAGTEPGRVLEFLGSHARQRRRRLRRYRHEPALRVPRSRGRMPQAGGPLTREIVLGVLSLIVWSLIIVVTLKYVLILLRADNNGEGGTLSLTALALRAHRSRRDDRVRPRHDRRSNVLGDLLHHAGDFGVVRGRRSQARDARFRALRRSDHGVYSHSACSRCRAAAPPGGGIFRADHGVWFVVIAIARRAAYSRRSAWCCWRSIRITRSKFMLGHGKIALVDAWSGVSCRDRRRSALCRSRTFRPKANSDRMALPRAACAVDQLFRAGRAGARRSGGDAESVLSPGAAESCCCRWSCSRRRRR